MSKRGPKVDYKEFIDAYMRVYHKGGNLDDVARDMGTTHSVAAGRKSRLRQKGIPLPPLANGNEVNALQIDELHTYFNSLTGPQTGTMKKPPVV